MIRFNCPNCNQRIKVPEFSVGKKGKCPKCKEVVVVPARLPHRTAAPKLTPQPTSESIPNQQLPQQQTPSGIAAPPRDISFFLRFVAFLGSMPILAGLVLFLISIAAYFVLRDKDINQWWLLLCLIGPIALLYCTYKSFQYSWLLKYGQVTSAEVVDIVEKEHYNHRTRRTTVTYTIYYEYIASDGKTYETKIRTAHPALLIDDDYETLLYSPKRPSNSVVLDYLPGSLEADCKGNIIIGSYVKAIMYLVIPIFLIACLIFLALIWIKNPAILM